MRKCIVKSKTYYNLYLCGTASYCGDLHKAKIFEEDTLPNYILDGEDEIIYLDSKKGLELLTSAIKDLDKRIPLEETRLNNLKEGREALFNANPEMVSKFVERYNKRHNPLIGISSEEERKIIEEIVEEAEKASV